MPSLNKDELVGLTTSLQGLTTRLRTTGRLDYETPAGREVALQSAAQLDSVASSFSASASQARQNGNHHLAPALSRVASSFERMNSGITTMVNAHKTMSTAGKFTAAGGFSYATGALSLMAGAASLIGSDGPDYSGPLSEIHAEINALRHELREEFRMVGQVLQNEIRAVGQMVAQVMVNQQVILNAVHQALDGIDQVKTLLAEHVQTTGATLTHIATKDLREARAIVERYRAGALITSSDPGADNIVLAGALNKLQHWFETELKTPVINEAQLQSVTSEHMVRILSQQSPLNNIGLIAARLRFLFGDDILDKKFTTLPPLEVYQSTVTLFLLGVQKSQLFSQDACQPVCQGIQETIQLYLDFIKALQGNARLWQALFDSYDTNRDYIGQLMYRLNSSGLSLNQADLIKTLNALEECRLLLITLGSDSVKLKAHVLESAESILPNSVERRKESCQKYTGENAFKTATEHGLYYLRNARGYNSANLFAMPSGHHVFPRLSGTAMHGYFQQVVDVMFLQSTQKPVDGKALCNGLLTLDSLFHKKLVHYFQFHYFSDYAEKAPFTYASLLMMEMIDSIRDRGFSAFSHERLQPQSEKIFLGIMRHDTLKKAFKYYQSIREGRLRDAELFVSNPANLVSPHPNRRALNPNDPHYLHFHLLFLVAMLGRWSIFENFSARFPLPEQEKFDFSCIKESLLLSNCLEVPPSHLFLTPLMIAAQHGREDVVEGLLKTNASAGIDRRCFENKTAAQLAYEQGFYKIAYTLKAGLSAEEIVQARSNISPDSPVTVDAPNPLVVALNQMIAEVKEFEAEFTTQAEAKQQRLVAVAAMIPTARAEETDDEAEDVLEEVTAEFCADQGIARVNASFWSKAIDPQQHKTGQRIIPTSFFQNKRQELKFKGTLREYDFNLTPDVIDNVDCLVAVMKRPIRQ